MQEKPALGSESSSGADEAELTTGGESSRGFMNSYSNNRTVEAVRRSPLLGTREPLTLGIWYVGSLE